jgi:lysophospholipase L1-like esterase
MNSPTQSIDYGLAAAIVAAAVAVSPIGIRVITGRLDLSPRVIAVSVIFDLFLLILAAAILSRGRTRQLFFHLLAWSFLLAVLALIEAGAMAIRLADRISPLEDMSILANKDGWPPHFMSQERKQLRDGLEVYRPWQGNGISINELGLRTAPPSPKAAGEWRIAVTGGSAAWGWRVRDDDTIPVRLQKILRARGLSNVTVYNFAIDNTTVAQELALVKRFRELYSIDEIVFYTGANDATGSYMGGSELAGAVGPMGGPNAFELIKVANRLRAMLAGPSPSVLAKFDRDILAKLGQENTLRDGVIEADEYCRALGLRCNFVLQPMLLTRKEPRDSEMGLTRTLKSLYPRYDEVIATMYRSSLATGLRVHDLSDAYDRSMQPYFFDAVHVNEAGNQVSAERVAAIVSADLH